MNIDNIDLFAEFRRFESDIMYDCHSLRAKVSRSESGKHILALGPKVMTELSLHLTDWKSPSKIAAISEDVKYGWGILLSWMCRDHKLDRQGLAQNDFDSWVEWVKNQTHQSP